MPVFLMSWDLVHSNLGERRLALMAWIRKILKLKRWLVVAARKMTDAGNCLLAPLSGAETG